MAIPHLAIRRLVIAPLIVVLELTVLVLSPVLLAAAVIASPAFGGWRPVRMLVIVLSFVAGHLAAIVACAGLWVAAGFGRRANHERMRRAHFGLLRWFVGGLYGTIVRMARVEVRASDSAAAEEALSFSSRPIVVFSRHAGEGDTLLVIHRLLCRYERLPRIVMHELLRLDPLVDVLGRRLPNRFVDPRGGDTEREIAALSRDMDGRSALVIFPEGANYSESHRRRGIERLERAGHDEEASWARAMRHVSAPRPGGALAAVEAAPDADVVIFGHVGFPASMREAWRLLPHPQSVELRLWLVPAADVPRTRDDAIDWLFGWWRTLDAWVEERHAAGTDAGVR